MTSSVSTLVDLWNTKYNIIIIITGSLKTSDIQNTTMY